MLNDVVTRTNPGLGPLGTSPYCLVRQDTAYLISYHLLYGDYINPLLLALLVDHCPSRWMLLLGDVGCVG